MVVDQHHDSKGHQRIAAEIFKDVFVCKGLSFRSDGSRNGLPLFSGVIDVDIHCLGIHIKAEVVFANRPAKRGNMKYFVACKPIAWANRGKSRMGANIPVPLSKSVIHFDKDTSEFALVVETEPKTNRVKYIAHDFWNRH